MMMEDLLQFGTDNGIIDSSIQKGFLKMPGCWHHAFSLSAAIEAAQTYQRTLIGVLIDIANAYGSARHGYLLWILHYYRYPRWFQELVCDWYTDLSVVIKTRSFTTNPVGFDIGVFQGDPFSVGIFLLAMNPLFQWLMRPEVRKFGFIIDKARKSQTLVGTGFVDDVSLITRSVDGNQALLNGVSLFMDWARFVVKLAKCLAFGYRYAVSGSGHKWEQFCPKRQYQGKDIPTCEIGKSFRFLGKNFYHSNQALQDEVWSKLKTLLQRIDNQPIRSNQKLRAFNTAVRWCFEWPFSIYDLSKTVLEEMDAHARTYLRRWSGLQRTSKTAVLYLGPHQLGIQLISLVTLHQQARSTFWHHILESKDQDLQERLRIVNQELKVPSWRPALERTQKHRQPKSISEEDEEEGAPSTKTLRKRIFNDRSEEILAEVKSSDWQGSVFRKLRKSDKAWTSQDFYLPLSLLKFGINAIMNTIPSLNNLKRWGLTSDDRCPLCGQSQTIMHVLSSCYVSLCVGKFTWRHNLVLKHVVHFLSQHCGSGVRILTDLPNHPLQYSQVPIELGLTTKRPDIIVIDDVNKVVGFLELTVPDEENMEERHSEKMERQRSYVEDASSLGWTSLNLCFEIGTRGFHNPNGSLRRAILSLGKALECKIPQKDLDKLSAKTSEVALNASYYIWLTRSLATWSPPPQHFMDVPKALPSPPPPTPPAPAQVSAPDSETVSNCGETPMAASMPAEQ